VGCDVENGELPGDDALIGSMICNICYTNAAQYLALPSKPVQYSSRGAKRPAALS
jgi:hypothetical protein